jgi:hypothetical protein
MKIIISLLAALIAVAGCRGREREHEERAIESARKPVEPPPSSETTPAQPAPTPAQPDMTPEDTDTPTTMGTPQADQQKGMEARNAFMTRAKQRLDGMQTKIADLEKRDDANSREAATRLRARYDALAERVNAMSADANWRDSMSETSRTMDELERDIDKATATKP